MNCPVCNVARQGIEIDYCPRCRGVWLDRGELDKIIEKSTSYKYEDRERQEHRKEYSDKTRHQGYEREYKKHRRKSFLEELFD
jgi:uncharacterized protein